MSDEVSRGAKQAVRVPVIVSIHDRYLTEIDSVVARCRRAGLRVTRVLRVVGVLNGTILPVGLTRLERVEGVAKVEQERQVQLPSPDEDVQ
jgi:methylmalonyl-CoA mutase cobalamin-binding subunit